MYLLVRRIKALCLRAFREGVRTQMVCADPEAGIDIDIHIHMHMYMYTRIDTHTYIHTYMHTYIHTYIHAYIHTYIRAYIHTHIHTNMHACIHLCMYTHIHKIMLTNTTHDALQHALSKAPVPCTAPNEGPKDPWCWEAWVAKQTGGWRAWTAVSWAEIISPP